jgi:membrane protease YdiL (CAAX protease family)
MLTKIRRTFCIVVLSIVLITPVIPTESALAGSVAPGLAAGLSLVPGLGQVVQGHVIEGLGWFVVSVPLFFLSKNLTLSTIGLDLWMYNIYDSYRHAGPKRVSKESVLVNYIAAFNPLNIWDPIGPPVLGIQLFLTLKSAAPEFGIGPENKILTPFSMAFIALGEEGLFRGFLYPAMSDLFFDSEVVGAITSSLVFSAAHALYAGQSSYAFTPYIFTFRTLLGLAMCWQTSINKYDLRKSIFTHTWFDVIYEWRRLGVFGGGEAGGQFASPSVLSSEYGKPTGFVVRHSFSF